jgi:hypothetical protein
MTHPTLSHRRKKSNGGPRHLLADLKTADNVGKLFLNAYNTSLGNKS